MKYETVDDSNFMMHASKILKNRVDYFKATNRLLEGEEPLSTDLLDQDFQYFLILN
jgi:hypothetical protein